jgi:glycosyltransferase involved in cell wall biosynthesis
MRADLSQLRILHVSEVHWGGVVTLLKQFTSGQFADGHQVHVLAPQAMPELDAVRVSWSVGRSRLMTYVKAYRELRNLVRELRPDVVHLHSFMAGFFGRMPGALPAGANRPAVVYQPHAWSFDLIDRALPRALIRTWERSRATQVDALVTNCWDEVEEGRQAGIRLPSYELGVAVDMRAYHPVTPMEQERYRRELGLSARTVVVCIARITRQKGQDLLIPAWERRPPPGAMLVLVGPGDTSELERLAPTQWGRTIVAVGEQADVRPWLWASDLSVLPSRYETVGLVIAESMAVARPVVACAVNGARETLIDGEPGPGGAVVPSGDMEQLIDEVTLRAAEPQLVLTEGRTARERALRLFSPPTVVARLDRAYRDAITHQVVDRRVI